MWKKFNIEIINQKIILLIIIIIINLFVKFSNGIDSELQDDKHNIASCCTLVFGSCRSSCENLSLVHLAADPNGKESKLIELRRFCPSIQVEFWKCMNHTLHAVTKGSTWSGRLCCPLALTPRCQNGCATSSNKQELSGKCRQSDEQNLFSCFDRQETGDECCGNARTSDCLQACRDVFENKHTPTKDERLLVERVCNDTKVLHCVKNNTKLTPINNSKDYLPCCDYTQSSECRNTCKHILNTGETTQEMIDRLEQGGCGPPLPHDPLWQCFLSAGRKIVVPTSSHEISQINQIGMDSAKLHCCHKGVAPKCRRLCLQTFSNDWTETRGEFETDCYSQIGELSLKQCLDEVDEPCELGCDGLSYCTKFNNRPTELFRSCTNQADEAARSDIQLWIERNYLTLPHLKLPIRNITECSPETWKAIACAMQIKPCTRIRHASQICLEDCYDILTKCMDWTKLDAMHSADSICSKLSSDDHTIPCVSLKPYIESNYLPQQFGNHEIQSPCKGHPCNATQVCMVNRHGMVGYTCVPGCFLGETSAYIVPVGSYVRIPVSLKQKGCLKICRCGSSGRIENCQPLPCISYDSCNLAGRKIDHSSWFYVECNICSCFAGEITCTKKQCHIKGISDKSYTSLPCNCPPHYVPVCGKNGNTYPSACVAKCTGLQDSDIEFGACFTHDPCTDVKSSRCPSYAKCIVNRQVCLSFMHRPCQQYECVNTTTFHSKRELVCDSLGRNHPSINNLIKSKSQLAYIGPCLKGCKDDSSGPVCGINGMTYYSECEAWNDYSIVDYTGHCQEIGLLSSKLGPRCNSIKCPALPSNYCQSIIPPGACCPICGAGAMRIVYSRKQIDRAIYALKGNNMNWLTLRAVLRALEGLIRLSQCRLSGFLTMETDLFVLIQSSLVRPSIVQIEACTRESEKIATLIGTQSHRVTSDLALSSLTVANMVKTEENNYGKRETISLFLIVLIAIRLIGSLY